MPSVQSPSLQPFPRLSIAHIERKARSLRYRQSQLRRLDEALVRNKDSILQALRDDFSLSDVEALFEYSLALLELHHHYDSLNLAKEVAASRAIEESRLDASRSVSTGIVYIIPQNGFFSTISPLCAATAAGNCVILELPQTLMSTSLLLRNLLPASLDLDTFAMSIDRPENSFMKQCTVVSQSQPDPDIGFKKMLFSPSPSNSFLFVDRSADLRLAARCIIVSRFGCNGSSPYAPSAVFVHEAVLDLLATHLIPAASSAIGKPAQIPQLNGSTKARENKEKKPLAELVESENATLLFSSTRGAIVQTDDSALPALLKSNVLTGSSIPLLLLCSVTSMDSAIDLASEWNAGQEVNPAVHGNIVGAFVFANNADAQYLATSIDADLTCMNNFPAQLMVGPKLPKSLNAGSGGVGLMPRYSQDMFQERRTVIMRQPSSASFLGDVTVLADAQGGQEKFLAWTDSVLVPLKPTGQRQEMRSDIFERGLKITASLAGIPLLVGLGYIGRFAVSKLGSIRILG